MFGNTLASDHFRQPSRIIGVSPFSPRAPPTHTHTHKGLAELRRVKLGNDSGFKADQSMAVYISL